MSETRPPLRAVLAHKWFHIKKKGRQLRGKLFVGKERREGYLRHQRFRAKKFLPLVTSKEFNDTPKLVFIHIPKTAGMSIRTLAENNYANATVMSQDGKFEPALWAPARVIGGHFQFCCFEAAGPRHVYIAVVRDPIERALSLWRYYSQHEGGWDERVKQGYDHSSFRNTLRSIYQMDFMHNLQCRYLTNRTKFADALEVMQSRPFIVGTFDQLDDWLNVITTEFDWPERDLPVVNYISSDKPSTDDPQVLSMLKRYSGEDRKLYEYVKNKGVYNSLPADFDRSPLKP